MAQAPADNNVTGARTVSSVHSSILVVGAGIAGITAAGEAAEAGYDGIMV